jgi:hypothetical protein
MVILGIMRVTEVGIFIHYSTSAQEDHITTLSISVMHSSSQIQSASIASFNIAIFNFSSSSNGISKIHAKVKNKC